MNNFKFSHNLQTISPQIINYDNPLGRALATEVVKKDGTVVMLDIKKDRGEEFARSLVEMAHENRAYFHECDVTKIENFKAVMETISNSLDVTILLNCSTAHLVATYYNVKFQKCFLTFLMNFVIFSDLSRSFLHDERQRSKGQREICFHSHLER